MCCERRQGEPLGRHVVECGTRGFRLAEQAGRHHAAKHAVARGVCCFEVAVRAAALGQLRQGDEECGFRNRQPLWLLAEIGEGCRAHALQIAAIGRQRQVALQDFAFCQPPLDLHGAKNLADFLAEAAAFARLDQPRQLHRQGRTARDDAAVAGELFRGPGERQEIDALMLPEPLVLIGHQHLDELRIDLIEVYRQPPASVGGGEGAKQLAVAIDDFLRHCQCRRQRRREGAVERFERAPAEGDEGNCRSSSDGEGAEAASFHDEIAPSPGLRFARPPSPRRGEETCERFAKLDKERWAQTLNASSPRRGEGGRAAAG